MAEIVAQQRATTEVIAEYVGPEGQLVVDITLKTVSVQDGVTPGGSYLVTKKEFEEVTNIDTDLVAYFQEELIKQ